MDGRVWAFGHGGFGRLGVGDARRRMVPTLVEDLEYVSKAFAAAYHSLAITAGGYLYTWGRGGNGQLGHGR